MSHGTSRKTKGTKRSTPVADETSERERESPILAESLTDREAMVVSLSEDLDIKTEASTTSQATHDETLATADDAFFPDVNPDEAIAEAKAKKARADSIIEYKSPEDALRGTFGKGSRYCVYYSDINPKQDCCIEEQKRATISTGEDSGEERASSAAAASLAPSSMGKDNADTMYISYARKNDFFQIPWTTIDTFKGERKRPTFEGQVFDVIPSALFMTPFMGVKWASLGKFGNVATEKDSNGNLITRYPGQPRSLNDEDNKPTFNITVSNKPLSKDGYHDENNRNPEADKYFAFVREEIFERSILYHILRDNSLYPTVKKAVRAQIESEILQRLTREKKAKNTTEARKLFESDETLRKEYDEKFEAAIRSKVTSMVCTSTEEDKHFGGYIEFQKFSRQIFRKAFKTEVPFIKKRLDEGYYNYLPHEYVEIMAASEGKLVYDHIPVLRQKTKAEVEATVDTHPYPFVELTWEERERITYTDVASILYDIPLAAKPVKGIGPKASARPFAIIIASFQVENKGDYDSRRAEREREWNRPRVFPSF